MEGAGVKAVVLGSDAALEGLSVLFVAGLGADLSEDLARRARALGILVNVEDVPHLCDFHVPAIVRRGDLVFSVSTKGRSPALARRLREWLESQFGPEWETRLEELAVLRETLRADGVHGEALAGSVRGVIEEKGWLK
nr:NAD(P)-dependent oxidoreductase [Rhizomicrobium palustre]